MILNEIEVAKSKFHRYFIKSKLQNSTFIFYLKMRYFVKYCVYARAMDFLFSQELLSETFEHNFIYSKKIENVKHL